VSAPLTVIIKESSELINVTVTHTIDKCPNEPTSEGHEKRAAQNVCALSLEDWAVLEIVIYFGDNVFVLSVLFTVGTFTCIPINGMHLIHHHFQIYFITIYFKKGI
jgi:hypothetical protein